MGGSNGAKGTTMARAMTPRSIRSSILQKSAARSCVTMISVSLSFA